MPRGRLSGDHDGAVHHRAVDHASVTDFVVHDVEFSAAGGELRVHGESFDEVLAYPSDAVEAIAVFANPPGAGSTSLGPESAPAAPEQTADANGLVGSVYDAQEIMGDCFAHLELVPDDESTARVRIWAEPPCDRLPFEFARHPLHGPLSIVPGVSLVRAVPVSGIRPMSAGVSVTVVASFSEASPAGKLDLTPDRSDLAQIVLRAQCRSSGPAIDLRTTDGTLADLRATIAAVDGPIILLVAGHGSGGRLAFDDGWHSIDRIVEEIDPARIDVAVLATCRSAVGGVADDANCAARLVRAGVPAAVGMASDVETTLARKFTVGLLDGLLAGTTIDEAVAEGRSQILRWGQLIQHGVPQFMTGVADPAGPIPLDSARVIARDGVAVPTDRLVVRLLPPARSQWSVGRHDEVTAVRSALADGNDWVAIAGRRGVGKTHTLRRVVAAADADIVAWLGAETERELVTALAKLADLVHIGAETEPDQARRVVEWLGTNGRSALLALDNVVDPEVVRRWMPTGGDVSVVLTTVDRSPWLPAVIDLEPLDDADAVELLSSVTGLSDPTGLRDLVEALDRLPLAIIQAGSYIVDDGMPVAEFTERLRRDVDLLRSGSAPDYPAPLVAVIAEAIAGLSDAERRLLAVLGRLDLDAVPRLLVRSAATADVLGMTRAEVDTAVRTFRRLGLVETEIGRGSLRIHRLTARIVGDLVAQR